MPTPDPAVTVERWFLREGTPWVVRDLRAHPAVARMLPFTVALGAYTPPFALAAVLLLPGVDPLVAPPEAGLRVLVVSLAGILTAVAAVLVFLRLRRTREALRTRTAGLVGIAAALVLTIVPDLFRGRALTGLVETVALLAVGWVLVVTGLGALLGWAVRRLVVRLVPLLSVVSRAIPLLLLLVAFLFINAEAWQMSANLSRGRLWGVVGFLVAVLLLFLAFRLPRELAAVEVPAELPEIRAACARTPLSPWAERLTEVGERRPLRRRERVNLVALLFVAQGLQVLVLSVAVFLLFLAFGELAITDATIESWVGSPPTPGVLWGFDVPVSDELIQVSIAIAALSALYFAVYTVTDQEYRTEFLDDLLAELRQGLLARECYLATVGR
ncbi:hypothetical protein [Pseudonocardia pini]|uniref:hypothetical protein n=1 Tax=Pseudonocardia pini TaxID=2758030 RepID=UPI0015F0575D|nr:hypothetical protein [Pseudonocardia pini]